MLNIVDYKRLEQLFSSLSSQQNFNIDVGEKETGITSSYGRVRSARNLE